MTDTEAVRKPSTRVLWTNTICFALSFAAWIALGPSGRSILSSLDLPLQWASVVKAIPFLSGALLRMPLGLVADRVGARLTFSGILLSSALASAYLSQANSLQMLLFGGLWLGLVGTTFTVGAQSVSSWTSPQKQGYALGVFGAGNIGVALTTLFLPILLASCGWRQAFCLYSAILSFAALAYYVLVPDSDRKAPSLTLKALLAPLSLAEAWSQSFYYTVTFGSFVALTLMVGDLYIDSFQISPVSAGLLMTAFTVTCSLARIPGGKLADRYGCRKILKPSLQTAALALLPLLYQPALPACVCLLTIAGVGLGLGMGAVMRDVAHKFPASVGTVGGLLGSTGGLGGFFLPQVANHLKGWVVNPFLQILPILAVVTIGLCLCNFRRAPRVERNFVATPASA